MFLLFLLQVAAEQPLNLTCVGAGTANKMAVAHANSSSHFDGMAGGTAVSGNSYGTTTVNVPSQQDFSDQVDVRLFSDDDRIRLPRTMLPPIRGGEGGWFKLKNIVAEGRSIRGSAAVNALNNPKIFIDRVTGTISISGKAGDYSGTCRPVAVDAPAKF